VKGEQMENLSIKNVFIFALGVIIGGASTYKIVKDRFEKQYEDEVSQYREYIKKKYESRPVMEMAEQKETVLVTGSNDEVSLGKVDYHRVAKDYGAMANKQDIESVMRERGLLAPESPPEDEEEDDEEDDLEDRPIMDIPILDGIYIIPPIEFYETTTGNEKISLEYYALDDVLVDDAGQPIDDRDSIVGPGNLEKFGYRSHNENTLYVRNHMKAADFEIIRLEDSYRVSVLNMDEPSGGKPITKNNLEKRKKTKKVNKDVEN
jgi:hypothetical protein